jgi:hypothetical protein
MLTATTSCPSLVVLVMFAKRETGDAVDIVLQSFRNTHSPNWLEDWPMTPNNALRKLLLKKKRIIGEVGTIVVTDNIVAVNYIVTEHAHYGYL